MPLGLVSQRPPGGRCSHGRTKTADAPLHWAHRASSGRVWRRLPFQMPAGLADGLELGSALGIFLDAARPSASSWTRRKRVPRARHFGICRTSAATEVIQIAGALSNRPWIRPVQPPPSEPDPFHVVEAGNSVGRAGGGFAPCRKCDEPDLQAPTANSGRRRSRDIAGRPAR